MDRMCVCVCRLVPISLLMSSVGSWCLEYQMPRRVKWCFLSLVLSQVQFQPGKVEDASLAGLLHVQVCDIGIDHQIIFYLNLCIHYKNMAGSTLVRCPNYHLMQQYYSGAYTQRALCSRDTCSSISITALFRIARMKIPKMSINWWIGNMLYIGIFSC